MLKAFIHGSCFLRLDIDYSKAYTCRMSIDEMTLREEIAREIEALPIESSITNALGMRLAAAHIARGKNNYMTSLFERQVDFE